MPPVALRWQRARVDGPRDDRARPHADVIVEIATIVTDDDLDVVAEGPDLVDPPARRGAGAGWTRSSSRCTPARACSRRSRRRRSRSRRPARRRSPFIQEHVARADDRPAVRQLDRHRSPLPRRLPARDRGPPALPLDRRVEHQGARQAAGTRRCCRRGRRSTGRTGRSTTSATRSTSCGSTASGCSSPDGPSPTAVRGGRAARAGGLMRAVRPSAPTAGPRCSTLADVADPVPGPDEILVDVHAAALNRADVLQRMGLYPDPRARADVGDPRHGVRRHRRRRRRPASPAGRSATR